MKHLPQWNFTILRAGRSDWPANVERFSPWIAPRDIERFELWFVWRGQGTVRKNGKEIPIRQGNLFWFHPEHRYEVKQDPHHPLGVTYIIFEILNQQKRPLKRIDRKLPNRIEEVDAALGESITRRVVELLWESYIDHQLTNEVADDAAAVPMFTDEDEMTRTNPFAPMPIVISAPKTFDRHPALRSADSLFRALLTEILHQSDRQQVEAIRGLEKYQRKAVTSVAMRMQEDPKTVQSVHQVAAEVGYSSDHFTRTFKKIMGCSPQQFLVNARITKAKHLLVDSELSIKEMADQLGYCNAYFFSRQFKTMTGKTPTQYRNGSK